VRILTLTCHPSTPSDAVRRIEAAAGRTAEGMLAVDYSIEADLTRLRVPAPTAPRIVYGLWEHTCAEAFVAVEGQSSYHEFNLSPSGEWAAFSFARYREGTPIEDPQLAPRISMETNPGLLRLSARISLKLLSPAHQPAALRVALAAVIEQSDAQLSYWALHHPPGRADFHHPSAFVLHLDPICSG
jgi:hypothetical protein